MSLPATGNQTYNLQPQIEGNRYWALWQLGGQTIKLTWGSVSQRVDYRGGNDVVRRNYPQKALNTGAPNGGFYLEVLGVIVIF